MCERENTKDESSRWNRRSRGGCIISDWTERGVDVPSFLIPEAPKKLPKLAEYLEPAIEEQVLALMSAKRESWQMTIEHLNGAGYVILKRASAPDTQPSAANRRRKGQ